MSTIEAVTKTASGAFAITFLGGNVAGTFDAELGAIAQDALDNEKLVEVKVEKRNGKVFVTHLATIEPPEELGGPPEQPATEDEFKSADAETMAAELSAVNRQPEAVAVVLAERARQEDLVASGKFEFTCASPEATDEYRLAVLVEEVGEVAKAVLEGRSDSVAVEIAQVAAVALAWVEATQ